MIKTELRFLISNGGELLGYTDQDENFYVLDPAKEDTFVNVPQNDFKRIESCSIKAATISISKCLKHYTISFSGKLCSSKSFAGEKIEEISKTNFLKDFSKEQIIAISENYSECTDIKDIISGLLYLTISKHFAGVLDEIDEIFGKEEKKAS